MKTTNSQGESTSFTLALACVEGWVDLADKNLFEAQAEFHHHAAQYSLRSAIDMKSEAVTRAHAKLDAWKAARIDLLYDGSEEEAKRQIPPALETAQGIIERLDQMIENAIKNFLNTRAPFPSSNAYRTAREAIEYDQRREMIQEYRELRRDLEQFLD